MAFVSVTIGGRVYRLACEDGEEARLESLAKYVNDKIEMLNGQFGEIGDQRLAVMSALTMADELFEQKKINQALEAQLGQGEQLQSQKVVLMQKREQVAIEAIEAVADRLERIGQRAAGDALR